MAGLGLEGIKLALNDYYDGYFAEARKQVDLDAAEAERDALQAIAGQKMAGSGAFQKTVTQGIGRQKQALLGTMSGNLALSKAGAATNLFSQLMDQQFQDQQATKLRKQNVDDTLRDTLFGVGNMALNTFLPGVSAGVNAATSYNLTDFLTKNNRLAQSVAGLKEPK